MTTAGWHPDPQNAARERYWDGQAWTDEYRTVSSGPVYEAKSLKVFTPEKVAALCNEQWEAGFELVQAEPVAYGLLLIFKRRSAS